MLNGIKALLSSEKAIAAGVLVILSTVFVFTGKMEMAEWKEYTLWALGIYTGGKTVQGVASLTLAGRAAVALAQLGPSPDETQPKVSIGPETFVAPVAVEASGEIETKGAPA